MPLNHVPKIVQSYREKAIRKWAKAAHSPLVLTLMAITENVAQELSLSLQEPKQAPKEPAATREMRFNPGKQLGTTELLDQTPAVEWGGRESEVRKLLR